MRYLTRKQATAYLHENGITVGESYLRCAACQNFGPQFRYLGKHPVYTKNDLDAWIYAKKVAKGMLEAFLQHKRLRLGPPTRKARRYPGRSHKRSAAVQNQEREERA
jgi:hypothetical protein